MKKSVVTVILLTAALACTSLTGCSSASKAPETAPANDQAAAPEAAKDEAAKDEAAKDEAAKDEAAPAGGIDGMTTFTVGFDADFPPYGYMDDNGDYVGFDLDLAKEVADRLGLEVVYQPIDWDAKDMELESGAIDCIWNGFTMSDERLDAYTWSEPYVDNSQVVVVAKDSGINSLADLAGKVLCVQADSSALEAIESEDHAELKASLGELMQVPEYNTAFMNLEAGAVDAIAMDVGVAKYQIESRGVDFVILDEKLSPELYGVGFKKGNTALRDAVQEKLDEMAEDGTLLEIATKWDQQDTLVLGN
ncbi:MAG: amino acid ABC transporter substrate-binding protein [Lachnospiraceae bacterium]|nr:amino acid ABC transporter substrate-binding protein [Lachnospiraceae bacterium]